MWRAVATLLTAGALGHPPAPQVPQPRHRSLQHRALPCSAFDFDGDGSVGVGDLLRTLSVFGGSAASAAAGAPVDVNGSNKRGR